MNLILLLAGGEVGVQRRVAGHPGRVAEHVEQHQRGLLGGEVARVDGLRDPDRLDAGLLDGAADDGPADVRLSPRVGMIAAVADSQREVVVQAARDHVLPQVLPGLGDDRVDQRVLVGVGQPPTRPFTAQL
jgi:hypothetical protein